MSSVTETSTSPIGKQGEMLFEAKLNDLGEFRLFGLAPGRYYISAEMPGWNRIVEDREFSGSEKSSGENGLSTGHRFAVVV